MTIWRKRVCLYGTRLEIPLASPSTIRFLCGSCLGDLSAELAEGTGIAIDHPFR